MRAAGVTKAVWNELDQDVHVQDALRRDLLNARALARVLKDRLGLDASIPGIVSAIKRYPLDDLHQRAQRAESALTDMRVTTRTQIACLGLRKDPRTYATLPRLFEAIDLAKGDTIRIIQGEEGVLVFIDGTSLDGFQKLLPEDQVLFVYRDLAELSVREPPWTQTVPGPIFLLTGALYAQGINVWGLLAAGTEVLVLIKERDLSAAHQTLLRIRERVAPEHGAPAATTRA